MQTSISRGFTAKQTAAFWRAFSASCSGQGLPAEAKEPYRKRIMLEVCGVEHMAELNRTDHFDKLMLQLALDSGDYELAARYSIGDERRLAKMVEVVAMQLMQCQGTDILAATAYVAGLVKQAGFPIRQDGPTYWMDLCAGQIHALFMALDTHRRRILSRAFWDTQLKFNIGAFYSRRADGTIERIHINHPPENYFKVNIIA